MTEKYREKIIKLRMNGCGYKAIGQKVNMSRDAVRNFCKRNGIDGIAEAAKKNYDEKLDGGHICDNCGLEVNQSCRGRKRRFCSDKCRADWWKKNYELHNFSSNAMHKGICKGCKKEFTSYSNSKRKFCSHQCYIKFRFGGKEND